MVIASRVWVVLCFAVLVGCGPKSVEISGTVKFDGKPVPRGRIFFNPDAAKGNEGTQGFAEIRDGIYDTRLKGQGAWGGPTIVVIKGNDGSENFRPLFLEYQEAVDLPKETCVRDFNVPASAAKGLPKPPPANWRP